MYRRNTGRSPRCLKNQAAKRLPPVFTAPRRAKTALADGTQAEAVLKKLADARFTVGSIKKSVKSRRPQPPFTTSTLQQEANRRLSFQSQRTMMIAQELYEGVRHRRARLPRSYHLYAYGFAAWSPTRPRWRPQRSYVKSTAKPTVPSVPNKYKSKSSAQDAHEAIRPADPAITPNR